MNNSIPGYGDFKLGSSRGAVLSVIENQKNKITARKTGGGDILLHSDQRIIELLFCNGITLYQIVVRIRDLSESGYKKLIENMTAKYGEYHILATNSSGRSRLLWVLNKGRFEIDSYSAGSDYVVHYTDMFLRKSMGKSE